MKFKISSMYCKYVIKILDNALKSLNKEDKNYDIIDQRLYESYLNLEKILNDK